MHPNAFPPAAHDTGMLQVSQVPGKLGLRRVQNSHQIANAKLPVKKKHHDSQSSLVGEGAKERNQRFHFFAKYLFMRICRYIRE